MGSILLEESFCKVLIVVKDVFYYLNHMFNQYWNYDVLWFACVSSGSPCHLS